MSAGTAAPATRDADELLTPAVAARLMGIAPRTLREAAFEGRIPSVRTPGGHNRYRRADLLAAMHRRPGEPG